MIELFNIDHYTINTSNYSSLLHDEVVNKFEKSIADYVGAKYAVSFNSATSAIFLALLNKNVTVKIPSIIPPVVPNAISTSGNSYEFVDNITWVGDSYIMHNFGDYKIIDSAQKLEKNQFKKECNPNDLMVFSFYPTKPVGTCDGGIIVSDDEEKINYFRMLALNGMTYSKDNWDRKIKFIGYKMYMNSIQADIALRNFDSYEDKINKLSYIKQYYNDKLGYNNTSNHLYRIRVNNRDLFVQNMKELGIQTGIHYKAAHLNSVYSNSDVSLPLSEREEKVTVSIPFHEKLSITSMEIIVEAVKRYIVD